MTLNPGEWLKRNKAVYFDNATSKRDYRVQLRGNRSVILFGVYLVTLIGVGLVVYNNSARNDAMEVVEAQRQLRQFYDTIMLLLAGLVSLIAPALTATTVVIERQRRSFDLIFSAPVTPKYFLVGKMISSFRYTWMLLVLALPVTAACVVLGGASWSDVLVSYLLLSLNGLMMTAIALLMSTVAQKPVSAVIWSYVANIGFLWFTALLSASSIAGSFMGGGRSKEAPFFSCLNPFTVQYTSNTYTLVGSTQVPNWLFAIILAGLISKICLVAAGSLLSPRPAEEIRSLRLHALAYLCLFVLYSSWAVAGSGTGVISAVNESGRALAGLLMPLFIFMPFLSTFGVDGERRFWPNGNFKIRHTLDGTAAGGLPFIFLIIGSSALAIWAGFHFGGSTNLTSEFVSWLIYIVGFWLFFWAVGRYASSLFVGLRSARTIQFASFIFFVVLPIPFLAALTSSSADTGQGSLWDFYVLRPLFQEHTAASVSALVWGILLAVVGVVVAGFASVNTKRKMDLLGGRYDGDL